MIKQAVMVLASFIAVGGAVMACNGNTGAGAADPARVENAAAAEFPSEIERLADNVFLFTNSTHRSLLVVTNDAVLATDPQGSQSNAERFVEVIREMTNAPIRYVVYSHHHGDHILGGEAFPADSEFIAHRNAEPYLETIRGLVIAGGDFDVDPALFGATERHEKVRTKDARTAFELAITRAALARDMPVLGICGGQQLLHVALGGTLIQHIPDAIEGALEHEQPNSRTEAGHELTVEEGTLLHRIVGVATMAVNSAHHQAAADAPPGVVVNARAPDGVIEGIEAPSRHFCLGVQWHPEYAISEGDGRIFAAFIKACRQGG